MNSVRSPQAVVPGTAPITGLSSDAVTGDMFQPDDQPAPGTPALTARTRVGSQLYSPVGVSHETSGVRSSSQKTATRRPRETQRGARKWLR